MTGLVADLRHALAVYRSTPVATAIAVVALAVAMAFVTAFLSMWSDLSLKPPEGFEVDELVTIGQSGGFDVSDRRAPLTLAIIEGINEAVGSLEFTAGIATFPQLLYGNDIPAPVQAEAVTRHFSDLQPRLLLGRLFDEQDHLAEAAPTVILSYRLWQSQFAGREDVLGKTVRITEIGRNPGSLPEGVTLEIPGPRGQDYQIVGVMSPRMAGTFVDTTDLWLPYEQAVPFLYGDPDQGPQRELDPASAITIGGTPSVPTRMRGLAVPVAGAEAISDELNARLSIESQEIVQGLNVTGQEMRFDVIDGVVADIDIQRESKRQIRLFLAGTLLLVLVAACNISLFLLARASRRQRELGIRMAVGASTKRLARQLTSEAGLLMFVATVLGVFISLWLAAVLRELPFLQQAEWRDVSPIDWRVLGLLSAVMLLLTLLVSLAPVIGLRRAGIRASSGMVTARASWGQRLSGTMQIVLTGIVAAVALAFAWHLVFYATVDRGFDPEDVLVVQLLPKASFVVEAPTQTSIAIERERQRDVVARLPGVQDASFATYAPGGAGTLPFTVVQRRPGVFFEIGTIYIDDHYFDVLSMPLLYGQNIDPYDFTQLVANESYAVTGFGAVDAIGETTPTNRTLRGVVKDVSFGHPAEAAPLAGFIANARTSYPLLLVKTSVTPARMRALLQDEIDAGELELVLGDIDRLENVVNSYLGADRARMGVTAGSALLVIILSALGFYGTQRYLVTAGQREYAIRSAIGAGPRALGRLVLSRGARLGLPGLVFGGLLAVLVVAWLRDGGFLVSAVSPASVSAIAVVMIIALVLAASLGPALQARRTAPAALLRED